ncbi:LAQU0S03e07096g1_1 [Lachancea quebecensis]|uniref:LAQU0S03e07096g1_1 n=1 Tax=Lachancea quebecensis TaxID=1654605 RepID=A0A0P1KNS7_9SACH|nr:LAQU0S03e07096g1_1 [Lachancea quebecensis]
MEKTYKLFVSTFNCGKCLNFEQASDIDSILSHIVPRDHVHDVYALGFQELVSLWQGSFPDEVQEKLQGLSNRVLDLINSLSPRRNFKLVGLNSVGAIGLLVFADTTLEVTSVLKASAKCGILCSSLKGATAIKFNLSRPSLSVTDSFIFVAAHLAANEGELQRQRREGDYNNIATTLQQELGCFEGNHVLFCGDFNFRSRKWASSPADFNNLELLQAAVGVHDELSLSRKAQRAFQNFEEAPITFAPTYKFKLSVPEPEYNPRRIPSWCDRILFQNYGSPVKILSYTACKRDAVLQFTDHLPVVLQVEVPHLAPQPPARFKTISSQSWSYKLLGNATDFFIGYGGWAYVFYGHWLRALSLVLGLLVLYHLFT